MAKLYAWQIGELVAEYSCTSPLLLSGYLSFLLSKCYLCMDQLVFFCLVLKLFMKFDYHLQLSSLLDTEWTWSSGSLVWEVPPTWYCALEVTEGVLCCQEIGDWLCTCHGWFWIPKWTLASCLWWYCGVCWVQGCNFRGNYFALLWCIRAHERSVKFLEFLVFVFVINIFLLSLSLSVKFLRHTWFFHPDFLTYLMAFKLFIKTYWCLLLFLGLPIQQQSSKP